MMGVTGVLSRIAQLQTHLGLAPAATAAPNGTTFASALADATGGLPTGSGVTGVQVVAEAAAGAHAPAPVRPAGLRGSGSLAGVPYADLFVRAGARYDVSPKLLAAVAKVESGYDPNAVSPAGAQGLMQLMPGTAKGLGVRDAFDPEQAVNGAAKLLSRNLKEFGSVPLALAAYNAGGGAVHRYGGIPPYAETQAYVPKVQRALAKLG